MASSDFPCGVTGHFSSRLIGRLTVAESPPTARDLDRSLTLPSVHAVAPNTEGDDGFPSLCIHPYASTAVAVFADTQAARPPCPRTLPVITVRDVMTAPCLPLRYGLNVGPCLRTGF